MKGPIDIFPLVFLCCTSLMCKADEFDQHQKAMSLLFRPAGILKSGRIQRLTSDNIANELQLSAGQKQKIRAIATDAMSPKVLIEGIGMSVAELAELDEHERAKVSERLRKAAVEANSRMSSKLFKTLTSEQQTRLEQLEIQ